jgi:hypothetical protein
MIILKKGVRAKKIPRVFHQTSMIVKIMKYSICSAIESHRPMYMYMYLHQLNYGERYTECKDAELTMYSEDCTVRTTHGVFMINHSQLAMPLPIQIKLLLLLLTCQNFPMFGTGGNIEMRTRDY